MAYAYEDTENSNGNSVINKDLVEENSQPIEKEEKIEETVLEEENEVLDEEEVIIEEKKENEDKPQEDFYYDRSNLLKSEDEYKKDNGLYLNSLITKNDQKYFDAALGKKANAIGYEKFNIFALLFGGIYFIYRGVFSVGFACLFIEDFVTILFPVANVNIIITLIFLIGMHIYYGCNANMIILNNVASKILNLKVKHTDNLVQVLKKRKKTFLLMTIIVIFVNSSILGLCYRDEISSIVDKMNNTSVNENLNTNIEETTTTVASDNSFNGSISMDVNIDIKSLISIDLGDKYTNSTDENYYYYYNYYDDSNISISEFELFSTTNFLDSYEVIKNITYYNNKLEEEIIVTEANGYTWLSININDNEKEIVYGSTIINNRVYVLKYTYNVSTDDNLSMYYEILNSIKSNT